MDITVGAVGFFHISDLRVEFLDGPIERVVVGDLLYTGRLLTLLAWLFEFVGKRARGVRLRDHIDDETANGGAEGADTAVRARPCGSGWHRSRLVAPVVASSPVAVSS